MDTKWPSVLVHFVCVFPLNGRVSSPFESSCLHFVPCGPICFHSGPFAFGLLLDSFCTLKLVRVNLGLSQAWKVCLLSLFGNSAGTWEVRNRVSSLVFSQGVVSEGGGGLALGGLGVQEFGELTALTHTSLKLGGLGCLQPK